MLRCLTPPWHLAYPRLSADFHFPCTWPRVGLYIDHGAKPQHKLCLCCELLHHFLEGFMKERMLDGCRLYRKRAIVKQIRTMGGNVSLWLCTRSWLTSSSLLTSSTSSSLGIVGASSTLLSLVRQFASLSFLQRCSWPLVRASGKLRINFSLEFSEITVNGYRLKVKVLETYFATRIAFWPPR